MKSLIKKNSVIICVGTGGVGKTTVAASLGLLAAEQGLKVLVLTIDPSKRLAQALGLQSNEIGEKRVDTSAGELYAGLIDAESTFAEFVREHAVDKEKIEKLMTNTLYRQLTTNLNGSQEFTSLDKLYRVVTNGKYDLVILDTPPAQNARDFFSAPQRIFSLFQKSVTRWFMQDSTNKSLIAKIVNKGTQTVLSALKAVTGSQFIGELSEFFSSIEGVQEKISERSLEVQKLLLSEQTKFILVTSLDQEKIKEARALFGDLKRMGYHLSAVIANKGYPNWVKEVLGGKEFEPTDSKLDEYLLNMVKFYKMQEQNFSELENQLQKEATVVKIPELKGEIANLELLKLMSNELKKSMGS